MRCVTCVYNYYSEWVITKVILILFYVVQSREIPKLASLRPESTYNRSALESRGSLGGRRFRCSRSAFTVRLSSDAQTEVVSRRTSAPERVARRRYVLARF